jgi:hypothetical protein
VLWAPPARRVGFRLRGHRGIARAVRSLPLKASALLLKPLELATLCAVMLEDDWEHDFRGDRQVFVTGTVANLAIVALFTAIGVALRGL